MSDPIKCPECVQGKHANCDGTAYDFEADLPAPCSCRTCGPRSDAQPSPHPEDVRDAGRTGEAQDGGIRSGIEALREAHTAGADPLEDTPTYLRRLLRERDEARAEMVRLVGELSTLAAKLARVEAYRNQKLALLGQAMDPDVREWLDAITKDLARVLSDAPATEDATEPASSEAHDCGSCTDCIHRDDGIGCCGCYDGVCCKEAGR